MQVLHPVTVCDRESTCDRMWQFFVTVSDGKWVILAPKWSSFRRKILPFAVMKGFRWDLQNEISTSISCRCNEHYQRSGGALKKYFYWGKDTILEKKTNVHFFGSIIEPCIALYIRLVLRTSILVALLCPVCAGIKYRYGDDEGFAHWVPSIIAKAWRNWNLGSRPADPKQTKFYVPSKTSVFRKTLVFFSKLMWYLGFGEFLSVSVHFSCWCLLAKFRVEIFDDSGTTTHTTEGTPYANKLKIANRKAYQIRISKRCIWFWKSQLNTILSHTDTTIF